MQTPLHCLVVSILAAATLSAPARAAVPPVQGSASATMSNVQFGVIDLTPGDGNAAGYQLQSMRTSLYLNGRTDTSGHNYPADPVPNVPSSLDFKLNGSEMFAATEGTIGALTSFALGNSVLGGDGYMGATSYQRFDILLRPYSAFSISGHVTTTGPRELAAHLFYFTLGQSYVEISDDPLTQSVQFVRETRSYGDFPDAAPVDEDFTVAFANGTPHDVLLNVRLGTQAMVNRQVIPVPEPSAAVLLGAGLLLLPVLRRRERGTLHSQPGR